MITLFGLFKKYFNLWKWGCYGRLTALTLSLFFPKEFQRLKYEFWEQDYELCRKSWTRFRVNSTRRYRVWTLPLLKSHDCRCDTYWRSRTIWGRTRELVFLTHDTFSQINGYCFCSFRMKRMLSLLQKSGRLKKIEPSWERWRMHSEHK